MTQVADYNVANDTGANVRTDINNILQAVVTQNAGSSAPSTTYARMLWIDESTGEIKIRNAANSAWITLPIDPDVSKQLLGDLTVDGEVQVNDLIESTANGFKFPDATTQTTAAVNKVVEVTVEEFTATYTRTSSSWGQMFQSSSYTLADAANELLVVACFPCAVEGQSNGALFRLQRTGNVILQGAAAGSRERVSGPMINPYDEDVYDDFRMDQVVMVGHDAPGAVGPYNWRVNGRCIDGTKSIYINRTVEDDDDVNHPRAAGSIAVIEYVP
jgi:hypothetical protein